MKEIKSFDRLYNVEEGNCAAFFGSGNLKQLIIHSEQYFETLLMLIRCLRKGCCIKC